MGACSGARETEEKEGHFDGDTLENKKFGKMRLNNSVLNKAKFFGTQKQPKIA